MTGQPEPFYMTAAEVARALGHKAPWFYQNYDRLVRQEGMPPAVTSIGHKRFVRQRMRLWLDPATRYLVAPPANDVSLPEDLAAQAACDAAYGPHLR